MFVTAWLFVEVAIITGGSDFSRADLAHCVAMIESTSVVFPVPGGPLTARISPCLASRKWLKASR